MPSPRSQSGDSQQQARAPLDVRGNGGYIVLAPSEDADGEKYEWEGLDEWRPGQTLPAAPVWLLDLICDQPKAPQQAEKSGTTPYGMAALEGELLKVGSAEVGSRNNQLNTSNFRVGQLVGGGEIEQDAAIEELSEAAQALSADDGQGATLATVMSGVRAGMDNPRQAPRVPMFLTDVLDTD